MSTYTVGEQDEHDEVVPDIPPPADGSSWNAPTRVEQLLYEESRGDDPDVYLAVVARAGLYHPVSLVHTARDPAKRRLLITQSDAGHTTLAVYTQGVLPRPHPYVVYEFVTLRTLADVCPEDVDVLAVNPGTPCAAYYAVNRTERRNWRDLHDEYFDPSWHGDQLITQQVEPVEPTLLHGLACGAHLSYANGNAWNVLDWHGPGYSTVVEMLEESWGIRIREDWLDLRERLLQRVVSPWHWDFVLGARNRIAAENGPRVDPADWRAVVEATVRRDAADDPVPDEELDAFVAHLRGLVGEVLRYEARFRADELLHEGEFVRSVAAWDLGRASKMARWGRGARYATQAEMYRTLEVASRESRAVDSSWREFSVGYILGRCLHFDEEEFGSWYTEVRDAHQLLTTHPESPWLTVPFEPLTR